MHPPSGRSCAPSADHFPQEMDGISSYVELMCSFCPNVSSPTNRGHRTRLGRSDNLESPVDPAFSEEEEFTRSRSMYAEYSVGDSSRQNDGVTKCKVLDDDIREDTFECDVHSDVAPSFIVEESDSRTYEGSSSDDEGSDADSERSSSDAEKDVPYGNVHEVPEGFSYMLPMELSDEDDDKRTDGTESPHDNSTEHHDEEENLKAPAHLYKKRTRHKKGSVLPSSRESQCVGPIEMALRASHGRKTEHIFHPKLGTSFDSAAEAYEFYNLLIRPFCITILYHNLLLFIDIFHI